MTNTALQTTEFNFYGDDLIAIKDNATGEIYASINHILRNIGFEDRQIKHIQKKWSEDIIVSKGVQNFVLPTQSGNQETNCISNRKLPIALTKINITPKMKHDQPKLASKLELYQDKCADVLAAVFIDNASTANAEFTAAMTSLNTTMTKIQDEMTQLKEESTKKKQLPEKRYSRWKTNTFNKLNTLHSYVNIHSDKSYTLPNIIHLVIQETEDTYDIEISDYVDAYKCEYGLEVNPYAIDVIYHYRDIKDIFTLTLDSIMERLNLQIPNEPSRNLFDELAAQM